MGGRPYVMADRRLARWRRRVQDGGMTWSILVRDPATGALGAAVATRFFAVGALLGGDAGRDTRQLHILSAAGAIAQHTGADCVGWCGQVRGADVSVAGNMLAGAAVLDRTLDAFAAAQGDLAGRLLAALEAGQAAGGDKRGRQSAALKVASRDPYPDLDIRADDHPDPIGELRRLHRVSLERFAVFRRLMPGADSPCGVFDRTVIEAAVAREGQPLP
jgi:uncharacterized Ntn-hydrolase superfamily protein